MLLSKTEKKSRDRNEIERYTWSVRSHINAKSEKENV